MPLYEYSCQDCEHEFETLVFDGDKVTCPECNSAKLERLLSLPGRPNVAGALPLAGGGGCGDPSLPPCGAPWCQRTGK